ncbi:hypothetical protein [Ottowia thiooxydans]|uniref:hypothetical protein n=1 Tax=Ottowia thiooxydans TaxID=219182 RepID=UPI0033935F0D
MLRRRIHPTSGALRRLRSWLSNIDGLKPGQLAYGLATDFRASMEHGPRLGVMRVKAMAFRPPELASGDVPALPVQLVAQVQPPQLEGC